MPQLGTGWLVTPETDVTARYKRSPPLLSWGPLAIMRALKHASQHLDLTPAYVCLDVPCATVLPPRAPCEAAAEKRRAAGCAFLRVAQAEEELRRRSCCGGLSCTHPNHLFTISNYHLKTLPPQFPSKHRISPARQPPKPLPTPHPNSILRIKSKTQSHPTATTPSPHPLPPTSDRLDKT